MHAVILAAGRGERLNGITAAYHKPMLVVNGKPLIRHAVEIATLVTGTTPIVVVAPENALHISQVIGDADMVIQRHPTGPGSALIQGLRLTEPDDDYALVLMADNVLTYVDVANIAGHNAPAVGVQIVPAHEAERFTRIRENGTWVEKTPVIDADIDEACGEVLCWVGPLKISISVTMSALLNAHFIDGELPIGPPVLNAHENIATIGVSTYDIGVPSALGNGEDHP